MPYGPAARDDAKTEPLRLPTTTGAAAPARRRLLTLVAVGAAVLVGVLAFAAGQASGPGTITGAGTGVDSARQDADQVVCSDFNARGGTYYNQFVVKIMGSGPTGQKSVEVDVATLQRGVDDLEAVGATAPRSGAGTVATPSLEKERATMTSSAAALGQLYANADTTTLLTAFVGTAIECAKLGQKPTWFEPAELSGGSGASTGSSGSTAPASGSSGSDSLAAPARPASTLTGGTYEVGNSSGDIAPGTYKATCSSNGYWARLRSTNSSDIIDNNWKPNGGPMIVTVKSSDVAVELGDCSWTRTK